MINKTEISAKLEDLKRIISQMDNDIMNLLRSTANFEVRLRKLKDGAESDLEYLEKEINKLINKYSIKDTGMKNTVKAAFIITIFSILTITGTSYSSKPEDKLNDNKNSNIEKIIPKDNIKNVVKKSNEPAEVINIWKEMPSYDRYGNEITARARKNMLENELSKKSKESKEVK